MLWYVHSKNTLYFAIFFIKSYKILITFLFLRYCSGILHEDNYFWDYTPNTLVENSVSLLLLVISLALVPSSPQIFCLSVHQSSVRCLSICPMSVHPSFCLSICAYAVPLSVHPSVRLLFCLSVRLSLLCPSVHLSNNNGSKKIVITTRPRFTIYPLPLLYWKLQRIICKAFCMELKLKKCYFVRKFYEKKIITLQPVAYYFL